MFGVVLRCETNLQEIMAWESCDMVKFYLEALLQGQTRTAKLKSADNLLIIFIYVYYVFLEVLI